MKLFQTERPDVQMTTGSPNALNVDVEIKMISVDSRTVLPGALFVAIKGRKVDGHQFIQDAIRGGAVAIIMEDGLDKMVLESAEEVRFIQVNDSKVALAHLVPTFFKHPANDLHLIGITGTNGKTTTCYLIDSLLRVCGLQSGFLSTITYRMGGQETKATHTTPGLLELHGLFSKMREFGTSHVAMEVSSHALDQGRVAGCDFEVMVFSNLTEEHLDYHDGMEAYYQAKKQLCAQTTGRCLINKDDPWGRRLLSELTQPTWSYGIESNTGENAADIFPKQFISDLNGIVMTLETPIGEIKVKSPLIGRYNAYNLMAAIGVGLSLGFSIEKIVSGIAAMQGVPGRFEKIDIGQDFTVIVDYAHTADALFRLLQTVAELAPRRIITLFGCGGDRDRGKRPKMAAAAAALSQKVILTSDNPRSESPLAIIREIEAGFHLDEDSIDYEIIPDRKEAIGRAIQMAASGDIVVIAGKGHETHQQIGEQRFPFDDRQIVREALKERFGR